VWNVHTNNIDRINDVVETKDPHRTAKKPSVAQLRAETVVKVQ